MSTPATTDFDYSRLDEETAGQLENYGFHGKALIRKSQIEFIAKLGEILSDARKLLANHKNGMFEKWATSEFDIGKQTVWNYVNAWDNILSNGWTIYCNLSPTALYLLANDDTPKPIQKKVEKLAASSGTVKRADIQRLIDASKKTEAPPNGTGKTSKPATSGGKAQDGQSETARGQTTKPADASQVQPDQETQSQASADPPESPNTSASIVLDALGREIPDKFREANELGITLQSIGRELDKFRQRAKELSEQPGGQCLQLQQIDECVRALKGHFQLARYHTACPVCNGEGGKCRKCSGVGWIPDYLKATI